MKKTTLWSLAIALMLIAVSCGQKGGNAAGTDASTVTAANTTVNKTPVRKEVKKMPTTEAIAKFGIDVDENCLFSGFYHAYTDASGKEVLHGQMELKTDETFEDFQARNADKFKSEEDPEFAAMFSYANGEYSGQYVDGVKDGLFKMKYSYHEAGGDATITFDAKTNSCVEGTFNGSSEAFCFTYKGKLSDCTFEALSKLTEEKECN